MFGNILNKCEEMRSRTGRPQHIHRKDMKEKQHKGGLRAALDRYGERSHTALDDFLRRGKELKTLIKKRWPLLGGCLRKD